MADVETTSGSRKGDKQILSWISKRDVAAFFRELSILM